MYRINMWLPAIPLCQHSAQQLQQLQPIQMPVLVVVMQHKEVEQDCGAQVMVGLGLHSCPYWTPSTYCCTASPCSRVRASTSCSSIARLCNVLCSSLGTVGL